MLRNLARHWNLDMRMTEGNDLPRRSVSIQFRRRERLDWQSDQPFRILSMDGGGIKGIFPAAVLADLEHRYLNGNSVVEYFDLITGTSTGGILALGLAAGLKASELLCLYKDRGREVFPPQRRMLRKLLQCFYTGYKRDPLERLLGDALGGLKLRDSLVRLCIPSLDWKYGDVYVFKTPHHPDFKKDGDEPMAKVATATAAAPTYFKPVQDGYIFADGGVWANNPIMIGLIEALSSFKTKRSDIAILSIGCGEKPYTINWLRRWLGGKLTWAGIIFAAMHFQSMNAVGQAGLLIGRDRIIRLDPPTGGTIELDDWRRAAAILPGEARDAVDHYGEQIASTFLASKAVRVPGIGCWDGTS